MRRSQNVNQNQCADYKCMTAARDMLQLEARRAAHTLARSSCPAAASSNDDAAAPTADAPTSADDPPAWPTPAPAPAPAPVLGPALATCWAPIPASHDGGWVDCCASGNQAGTITMGTRQRNTSGAGCESESESAPPSSSEDTLPSPDDEALASSEAVAAGWTVKWNAIDQETLTAHAKRENMRRR